jgi:hypothetical protein
MFVHFCTCGNIEVLVALYLSEQPPLSPLVPPPSPLCQLEFRRGAFQGYEYVSSSYLSFPAFFASVWEKQNIWLFNIVFLIFFKKKNIVFLIGDYSALISLENNILVLKSFQLGLLYFLGYGKDSLIRY